VKLTRMPHYFFHLIGDIPAHDFLGHECESDDETRDHASFLAHRIGTEKPEMVKSQTYIQVVDQQIRRLAGRWLRLTPEEGRERGRLQASPLSRPDLQQSFPDFALEPLASWAAVGWPCIWRCAS
jgi:hypothetical protein